MLDVHATLTLTGEGSIVFVQPFPIAYAMGQAIAPSLAGGFQLGAGVPPVTEFITAEGEDVTREGPGTRTAI